LRRHLIRRVVPAVVALGLLVMPGSALARIDYEFQGPVFGLAGFPGDGLMIPDSGAGLVQVSGGEGTLFTELPGVGDVAPIGPFRGWALIGGEDSALYRYTKRGGATFIADIAAFEADVNPDGGIIETNAFDLARAGKLKVLIADAAGNALLISQDGVLDWIANLPSQLVRTRNAKQIAGCPNPPDPELEFVCDLPRRIPAEPVATSVAVGPDGAYYVSELKGFPAPRGKSRVWRIEPGARHAECGTSPECSVVLDGLTSIVDINFGPDGTLYVVELDEASWLAAESGQGVGGTVNACNVGTGECTVLRGDLPFPMAAVHHNGRLRAVIRALEPDRVRVIRIA